MNQSEERIFVMEHSRGILLITEINPKFLALNGGGAAMPVLLLGSTSAGNRREIKDPGYAHW